MASRAAEIIQNRQNSESPSVRDSSALKDAFGRRFSYLRLSVTDACNFRCVYCLPNGYKKPPGQNGPLAVSEIQNLIAGFAEMGTTKVRLTGGEPTLRSDFLEIVQTIRDIPGIDKIAVSTNGFNLRKLAKPLWNAGVRALNISLDSLDEGRFASTTGTNQLPNVLAGIEAAFDAGFPHVKINAVLMAGVNDDDLHSFLEWIRFKPITVRFIELMPTTENRDLFTRHHVQAAGLRLKLMQEGWAPKERGLADGPAQEYEHPDYKGAMGLIAPYAKDFCSTCNRLRITSQGGLRLCLFGEGNHSLRDLLQSPEQRDQLRARVLSALQKKEISHYLPEGRYGNNSTFSAMGG